jgi:hypothetical protein
MSTIITNTNEIGSSSNNNEGELDLNKIFQLNLSYNFDLLKTVLDGILKAQKSMQQEITDLKNDNQLKEQEVLE